MARVLWVYFLWVKMQFEIELELVVHVKMLSALGVSVIRLVRCGQCAGFWPYP
ncbi:hypothetical protein DF22_001399 [Xylella fastidiosa]|nr:hypothetical protein Xfasm12_0621 [Xylella fastidiosa M12]ERI59808.1 hypothetical protein M233_07530 [Xylella fastidiosa subsp. multiplex Griffin-1]KFA41956.1 hypothetical protein DF22_001399 [Xylella fastidiosa]